MTKRLIFPIILLLSGYNILALPHAWINEIHYDNEGTDRNEFVEVVVQDPENWYLGDLVLYMYNGYDGVQYCLDSISEFESGDRENGYQIYTWFQRGIQNDTEGMILVFRDTLIDILAYEGSFTGTNEPADGILFPDIGAKETGSGPDTCAIYLNGMPGSDWIYGPATPGEFNPGQTIADEPCPVILETFDAAYHEGAVHLNWSTASETETSAFRILRNDEHITTLQAQGYSSSKTDYHTIDNNIQKNVTYRYALQEIHFSGNAITLKTLTIHTHCPRDFGLGRHFPNPANPDCKVPLDIYKDQFITIKLYDLKGSLVKVLFEEYLTKGSHELSLDLRDLATGNYICLCQSEHDEESFEITLLK